jgi:hypothetical protein
MRDHVSRFLVRTTEIASKRTSPLRLSEDDVWHFFQIVVADHG